MILPNSIYKMICDTVPLLYKKLILIKNGPQYDPLILPIMLFIIEINLYPRVF